MAEMGEYWKDVKPFLQDRAREKREQQFDKRLEYAINQFKENNIEYKLCKKENGHFNLYKNKKVVLSFWSYTGRIYSNIIEINEDYRGIKNCIKTFKKNFMNKGEI